MKVDGLIEQEYKKLRKVKLFTDPKKPLLPYEGYILGEESKFAKVYENLFSKVASQPSSDPGTSVRSKVGGVLSKVGQTYQNIKTGSEKLKQLGQGDYGVLKDFGISMLQKQLDLDTNKVSVFGTKGHNLIEYTLTEEVVGESVVPVSEAAPVDLRGGAIFGAHTDVFIVDEKTGLLRKAKPNEIPPIKIPTPPKPPKKRKPKPKPTPEPGPEEVKPKIRTVKLLLKIIKKDNFIQSGVPYVLVPANEETKKAMEQKNLSYAKFVKHVYTESQVENASILDNSGLIHFYNLQNQYVPEYSESVNYVYKAPYYVMGTSAPRQITVVIDPSKNKTGTVPATGGKPATPTPAASKTPVTKPGTTP